MKKVSFLFILFHLLSCDKIDDCPGLIQGKPENHSISDQELTVVRSLFKTNNLSYENLQFVDFIKDELGIYHITCNQFVNNLKIFTESLTFHFAPDGHRYDPTGEIFDSLSIDSIPEMKISDVKNIFIDCVKNDDTFYGSKEKVINGCLICELGYYDLNASISYSFPDFKLVWKISSDIGTLPYAYVNDTEKSLIYYDNGIMNK